MYRSMQWRYKMAQETKVQSQVESYQRLRNGTWYLLLNTYKVRIKGKKLINPGKRVPQYNDVIANEKGTLELVK